MITKTFSGGYSFKRFTGQADNRILPFSIPPKIILPLSQGFGSSMPHIVKLGDRVKTGEVIARDDNRICSPIHSSVTGKVISIEKRNYFNREVTMVGIKPEGDDDFKKLEGHSAQWEQLPPEQIEQLLYESGVTALDREGIPTRFKSSIINSNEVEDLIIHGAMSEAYNMSLDVLLGGKSLFNCVEGIKILKKIMPQSRVHLALNVKNKTLIEHVKKLTSNLSNFTIHPVVAKYPQGYDEVLVPSLLGKKFPYGYSAANIGIVVLNIQAVMLAFEAVVEGKVFTERTIALCGPAFKENFHIKARIGTPLEFILKENLKDIPARLVLNSLLTGPELKDLTLPVDKTFSQIIAIPENTERELLAFLRTGKAKDSYSRSFLSFFVKTQRKPETNFHGEQRPCIQCGYCAEVCPVNIIPNMLYRYAKAGIHEVLMKYGIFNCIDCNLCSYVCPSKIPLSKNLKDTKARLIESGCDHSLCILPKFNLKGLTEYKGVKTIR